jgi:lysophospholipase L1-like esterase
MKTAKNIKKLFSGIILFLILMLACSITANIFLFDSAKNYYKKENAVRLNPLELDYFDENPIIEPGLIRVVFLGDSRAAQWNSPDLDGFQFVNRGIGGQTSNQIIERYDDHVEPLSPDFIVLQMCINDLKTIPLFPGRSENIVATCKENIEKIVEWGGVQETTVILTTVFPVGQVPLERSFFWSDDVANSVNKVNTFIKGLDNESVIVFDSYSILADEDGSLRDDYSRDEIHLSLSGYEALNNELVLLLSELK